MCRDGILSTLDERALTSCEGAADCRLEALMPSNKISVHLVNENGAIICSSKTSPHKAPLEAWEKLTAKEQCGNCREKRKRDGAKRGGFGTIGSSKSSTDDPRTSYTPRYGQQQFRSA